MTHLDVSYNRLSGNIFNSSDSTCSSLKVLNISSNFYSGPPLLSLGLKNLELHSSLEVLDASYNSFTGELPKFHANLKHLDFSSNMFTKTSSNICPTDSKLRNLLLPNNRLTGPLLDSLVDCRRLQLLDVSFNELTGGIPDQLCSSLPKLQHLHAWGNGLQGSIPSTLGNCVNLSTILLSHNNLNGSIPTQLSGLHKLWWLSLGSNYLTGKIPSSFGELDNLVCLQLTNNSLEGEIPKEMDGSKSLYVMELASNSFSGKLPGRIGRKFSGVEITGSIVDSMYVVARTPGPICKGSNMLFIVHGIRLHDLERHLFARTGCFAPLNINPPYVLNISSPLIIQLSYNQLSGEIPEEIGLMRSLLILDVAHNNLSGRIPEVLGNLEGMQVLDLSENALHGSIPASLSQLTFLFLFNVSYNNLSGRIPQSGQFFTFTGGSFEGNPELCGLPLPTKCFAADPPVLTNIAHPISDDGIQDILVAALVSETIAFVICCALSFYCSSKYTYKLSQTSSYM
ncbi:protein BRASSINOSTEROID INSENSITIVE 1-like [Selaginella moellendorffii]|uniref:protein BRASSINOSTEROID INSENSITIVE 1-like n=1 Tax=Selaginella moellendorffii TaxID=88036 RepID=UPI000D1C8682|nr:protein BRASSINOSTEROID INSENSITIVE 1-like [Selaginella moellendorffii]|eukprot:XP_024541288.1 protein BRASSINOSTEROID INSENSITIVE 1-like [Selaginella moellendorffii]